MFGFSINTLTLFAMVLAIGIVVDDAIVVLENVERLMREKNMRPMEAAVRRRCTRCGGRRRRDRARAVRGVRAGRVPRRYGRDSCIASSPRDGVDRRSSISGLPLAHRLLTPVLCALLLHKERRAARVSAVQSRLRQWRDRSAFLGWVAFVPRASREGVRDFRRRRRARRRVVSVSCRASFLPPEDQGLVMTSVTLPTQRRSSAYAGSHASSCAS